MVEQIRELPSPDPHGPYSAVVVMGSMSATEAASAADVAAITFSGAPSERLAAEEQDPNPGRFGELTERPARRRPWQAQSPGQASGPGADL